MGNTDKTGGPIQNARVIACFAKKAGVSLSGAMDLFYRSQLYRLMRDGVSDLHCMSDDYLADELSAEYQRKNSKRITPNS